MSEFRASDKQVEIMTLVVEAAARGRHVTASELMVELSYKPSRSALHCSLKFLKRHGFIDTVNHGRNGANVVPTVSGASTFKSGPGFP